MVQQYRYLQLFQVPLPQTNHQHSNQLHEINFGLPIFLECEALLQEFVALRPLLPC